MARPGFDDPQWYRRAVFYEVFLRGFSDSSGDGTGDLRGLTERLDHLDWLGVDCVWLLPFYASPLRDGGYDISDFFTVHPIYGVTADVIELVDEAHKRGMRVIADMVMNHTSDQHPWFQESRQNRTNDKADWYVWNDDDQRWADARIIFHDTERSNWTWDPQREQYFWHRFFSHQPDLNYRSPDVTSAMLDVVRYWLDLGMDGFRLDAVPYLFEADGTNGENLPETYEWLQMLRNSVDSTHPGKVLLAEANQWPSDVLPYFGKGDSCHMCFHFPLMPRIYLAAKRGERGPIEAILEETPEIPDGCQWGLFLRNHDELTLEMVTDAERDEMYAEYAADPMMRRNSGIGRRLAPLLHNSRPMLELFYWLLFTLPGSPVLYYGDEIGMGDNVFLGDRDSVRTPMQWTGDRNAGFSPAPPETLYLPLITDPVYGFQAINVESQRQNGGSMLRWLSHILSVRREHPQLAVGDFTMVPVDNPAIFAYIRGGVPESPDPILCVANLHRQAQPAAIPLPAFLGSQPVELLGDVAFPAVGTSPYPVTLGSRGFLAFELVPPEVEERTKDGDRAVVNVRDLATPALVLDAATFERNLTTMAAARPGRALRPHVKAHKCTEIARAQAALGHRSFTSATPREMLGMAAAGLGADLLLANETVDPRRLTAMAAASAAGADVRMTVAVDSEATIEAAAAHGLTDVLVDVDVGLPRCGCPPADAGRLAEHGRRLGLEVRGVMGYEGHLMMVAGEGDRRAQVAAAVDLLLAAHGDVGGEIISAGGTGTYALHDRVTEVQAGSYALMDTQYATLEVPFEPALAVLGTVISVHPQWAVLDVGLKALGMDHGNPEVDAGTVWFCSDEHLTFAPLDGADMPHVGERRRVWPAHIDPTVAQHERIHVVDRDEVVDIWAVDLRGW